MSRANIFLKGKTCRANIRLMRNADVMYLENVKSIHIIERYFILYEMSHFKNLPLQGLTSHIGIEYNIPTWVQVAEIFLPV